MATKITKSELKQMIRETLREELFTKKYLIEAKHNDLTKYRVALADYEDDDGYDQEDVEYLLKPGQTKGDLVKDLSYNAGFIGIYVHDERLATPAEIDALAYNTIDKVPDDSYEYYGSVDIEDWD
jgi:hypothetical protein